LEDNTELTASNDFDVEDGEVQVDGKGRIKGKVRNKGLLKAASNKGLLLDIDGDFDHDGEIDADIEDEKQPGKGFTRINIKGHTKLNSKSTLNLCIKKKFDKKTRIEMMTFKSLEGRFKNIKFTCKGKSKRDLEYIGEIDAACPPQFEYGGGTFAVLLGGACGGSETLGRETLQIMTWCFLGGTVVFWIVVSLLIIYVPKVSYWFYGYKKMTQKDLARLSEAIAKQSSATSGLH
jgi:hypothetical protein